MNESAFRPFSAILIAGVRVYRYTLSPVFYALGVRCRHEPTCSEYGADCVRKQGAWRGIWLTLGRIARCRPGGTQGYDPAPEKLQEVPWWALHRFRHPHEAARNPSNSRSEQQDKDQ
ncbi:membrane protein insertion efficiency factor YidD [Hyphobacterium sp.]|uniref:membrane protein insertion efficiency factor YidD n=1 Tax=Hyphobacterium sp. TaxID=2004662 RepID=UPI003B529135